MKKAPGLGPVGSDAAAYRGEMHDEIRPLPLKKRIDVVRPREVEFRAPWSRDGIWPELAQPGEHVGAEKASSARHQYPFTPPKVHAKSISQRRRRVGLSDFLQFDIDKSAEVFREP